MNTRLHHDMPPARRRKRSWLWRPAVILLLVLMGAACISAWWISRPTRLGAMVAGRLEALTARIDTDKEMVQFELHHDRGILPTYTRFDKRAADCVAMTSHRDYD